MIIPIKSRYMNLSEADFFNFCQEMQDYQVERDADGTILIMEPTGSETGSFNAAIITELTLWNREHKYGKTFDSSTGFTLPNNSVRSPDVSWIEIERWLALPLEDRQLFAHISPDFVIEIRSRTDRIYQLKDKMLEYQENGVRLAWLIDPIKEEVWVYRSDGSTELVPSFNTIITGEDVLEGFELLVSELWNPGQ